MIQKKVSCDICLSVIYEYDDLQQGKHNGVLIELGYSKHNGWGNREDWLKFNSEHICDGCFARLEPLANAIVNWKKNQL